MEETTQKIKILFNLIGDTFCHWRKDVWAKDLDAPYCCSGDDCGCGAATVREIYTHKTKLMEGK